MVTKISAAASYQQLKQRFHMIAALEGASGILYMDSMTAMKPGSSDDRSEQMMAIASANHTLITDPAVSDWLDGAEEERQNLSVADAANLSLMRRNWVISTALPEDLVRERTRLQTEGNNLHTAYRDKGDWKVMRPVYENAFRVSREIGDILKDRLDFATPYEALLDQFSPGLELQTIEREFALLEKALPAMIAEAVDRQKKMSSPLPLGDVPVRLQKKINQSLVRALGFNENKGILYSGDMHPVSGGTPDDARMTTSYAKSDFFDGYYTTAHETGHSLYEQNTPPAWRYQPAGHTLGMDIHESQSMIIQYHACMIPEFVDHLSQAMAHTFNRQGDPALAANNLKKLLFHVVPSLVRVTADELTYPGHIILRFNLERDLISGVLAFDDLPEAWNEGMKKTFGLVPPGPAKGHMQDVHWPTLSIGYFPAYTLGAMGASQFFAAATKAQPEIRSEIGQGDFTGLRGWLNRNVHGQGSLLTPEQLFVSATGEPLNANYYLNHLSRRYLNRDYQP